jgi:serine/threonine-protein kinase
MLATPHGARALKVYDAEFSTGDRSRTQKERVELQVALGDHTCPSLVKIYDGGLFEDRLFLLMSCAPGQELEKILREVPRDKIATIVHQIAEAATFLRDRGYCHRDIKSANIFVSDDFESSTLLDLSVAREVEDPIGVGTDHGDQLPVVATARYSPPEYLFRLIEPGPALWQALDVYQMGALLHDLIMRQPLFQREYEQAKENRYRFAWTVATVVPEIDASDVPADLIFLAKRALGKDWQSRSDLSLEDFLADRGTRRDNALALLGIGEKGAAPRPSRPGGAHLRAEELAKEVEGLLVESLRDKGGKAHHRREAAGENAVCVCLTWVHKGDDKAEHKVQFELTLRVEGKDDPLLITATASLTGMPGRVDKTEAIILPEHRDGVEAASAMAAAAESALGELAVRLADVE